MAQWGNQDANSNSVLWAPTSVKLAPNTANRNNLYGNTTADAFITGKTVGVFGVDSTEIKIGELYLGAVAANSPGTGGSYAPGEILTITSTGATSTAAATVSVTTTKVRTVAILAGHLGSGYANGDTVTCNSGVMTTNAVFTVTTGASNTSIASLALTTNGVFLTNPVLANTDLLNVVVANTSANGAQAVVTMRINSLSVAAKGDYSVVPTEANNNALSGSASGTGATAAFTWATGSKGVTHTGWVLRTVGSGGRAGRVQTETLVAGGITTDGSDDTIFPDA